MFLIPQIFDVTANENARYKRNELELMITQTEGKVVLCVTLQLRSIANVFKKVFPFINLLIICEKRSSAITALYFIMLSFLELLFGPFIYNMCTFARKNVT